MTVDQIESWVKGQMVCPLLKFVKQLCLNHWGNISFEVYPEYEPIKKIYFDEAVEANFECNR